MENVLVCLRFFMKPYDNKQSFIFKKCASITQNNIYGCFVLIYFYIKYNTIFVFLFAVIFSDFSDAAISGQI